MMLANQDISTHRYFGDNDDDENSSSSQSPPSNHEDSNNNYFFSYGRSSSIISQQFNNNNTKHHSNHSSHHTYKVLVSGGGFAGLVFSYYLLQSLSHKHNNLPIEITIVEKASMYRQVGAIITLEGDQVLRSLKEMNLEEELHQIEIPRSKQHFYTKNGRHVRSFDETSVVKYKEEGRRYERHKFHEILMKRIKPLIVRRDGNLTILSNSNLHSNSSTPSEADELTDDRHFKMNRVIYSMRPSLFNKEKIEVTLMNKNEWLRLQYQKEHQENIQMKRSSSICNVNSPAGNSQRILNDISNLDRKDTPTNRLSKLHKRKSTGSSGDLQQMEEEATRKATTAETATPNSAGKESAGWRRFFQKKESNAQSPSQKTKSDSSSNILLEGSPMSTPLNTINDPKRTSMNDLLVNFNDGDSFESSVYQSTEDSKLYQIEREEYDLVVGSDGIHSQTRALIFGDESNFKHFLGVGYFCFIVDMILTDADEQQVSEKYWNNVYGTEKKSTECFDPTQISGIKGLEPLTPERIAKMKEVSKKLAELIKDGESSSVLLNHGRYMNVLRYGNKLSVSLVYRQPKEEEMLNEGSSYTVSKNKSFVDDSLIDSPNDSKSSPSTQEKWRKRFSLFRKHTESPIKNDLAQDPSSSASSLTNHFYSFDINKFEDHHDNDDQRSVTHSSDSSEDHEEVMEEEDEEIAEAFMEMVHESIANKESSASVQSLEEKCSTPNSSSSPTSSDEKSGEKSSEKKQKKKKVEKSHHSKTFFISAENRKNFLKNKFEDCGFLFHEIMDLVFDSRIIYYDDLAQIRNLDRWYKGKCVLVGDACQACTPLSGKGGALAIIAAKTLALELRGVLETHASTEGEDNLHTIPLEKSIYFDSCLQQAFEKYENAMQERIKTVQKKTVWEGVDVYLAKSGVKRMVRDGALKFLPKSVLLKLTKKEEEQGSTIIVKK